THHHPSLPLQSSGTQQDPVCGMQVGADTPHRYTFEEKEYLFCCGGCREAFAKDPGKYLSKRENLVSIGRGPSQEARHDGHDHAAHAHGQHTRSAELIPAPAPVALATGTEYTCPMHPEVRQPKPGACPKCGMALEPVKPVVAATKTEWTCPMHPQIV